MEANFLWQAEPVLQRTSQIQDSNHDWRRNVDDDLMTASTPSPVTDTKTHSQSAEHITSRMQQLK